MYEKELAELVEVIWDLVERDYLECNGGALAIRLPDGNIAITPTGAAVRRWKLAADDIVIIDPKGRPVRPSAKPSAASTLQCLMIFDAFPAVNAIIHSHGQWSLTYAVLGRPLPQAITSFARYGEVPSIVCDDAEVKARFLAEPWSVPVPESMAPERPDVAAVGELIAREAIERLRPREAELQKHGLAFTMYRHGLVVLAGTLLRAVQDVIAIEANCRVAWRAQMVQAADHS